MKERRRSSLTAGMLLAACGLLVGTARGGVADALKVKPSNAQPATTITQSTTPGNAITPFVARGTGVIDFTSVHSGVCADQVPQSCNGGSDSCECDVFVGSVKLPKLGNTTMTLNITTDDTSGSSNGTGSCFSGTGHGTFCNSKNQCLAVMVSGNICTSVVSSAVTPPPAVVTLNANEVFWIDPVASTGPVANASGGGNLSIPLALNEVSTTQFIETGYTVINGTLQSKPTTTNVTVTP
jgi:hypothetical protein